jgi:hypothetical protein
MKVVAEVTKEQKDFLDLIVHTDAANSIGGAKGELGNAVQWCIDACMKIEERYGIDACYVGHYDIRLPEHDPSESCKSVLIIKTTVDNLSSALDQSSLQQSPDKKEQKSTMEMCAAFSPEMEESAPIGEDDIEARAKAYADEQCKGFEDKSFSITLREFWHVVRIAFTAALKEFDQKSKK